MASEEGLGIEVRRNGKWSVSDYAGIKDGDEFRVFGGRGRGPMKIRIADGDAFINDRGNWSVKVRPTE